MKRKPLILLISVVLIVIIGLLSVFTFQVRISEVAVVTTFSKPTAQPITNAGVYFAWPPPIQRVHKFDKRIQNFEDKFTEDFTADQFSLLTTVYVGWRITDPKLFMLRIKDGSVAEAERKLEGILRSEKSGVVGKHPLSDFINANEREVKLDAIESEIQQSVRAKLETNNWGVEIAFLGIKRIGLPEAVTSTVFDRMISERQILIRKTQDEGDAEAAKIRSAANRKAAEQLANADAQATRIRGLGEATAAESLPVFQQNPALAAFLFRLNSLEASVKEHSTLVFDQRTPPFDLFQGIPTNLTHK
jgi:modulator of FtsH protease HflC